MVILSTQHWFGVSTSKIDYPGLTRDDKPPPRAGESAPLPFIISLIVKIANAFPVASYASVITEFLFKNLPRAPEKQDLSLVGKLWGESGRRLLNRLQIEHFFL